MGTLTIRLPELHPDQREVAQSQARFLVLSAGRRWGKTRLGCLKCVLVGACGKLAWWVAPSYKMAAVGWRLLRQLCRQIPGTQENKVDRMVTFPGEGFVQVRSADDPDSLRGEGLDFVALDECAFMKEAAWLEALRPALSDKKGRALFISTPKGRNWFWREWIKGLDDAYQEYRSWQFPTASNPYIDPKEIEEAKNTLPESIFQQEYLAEFVEDAGIVFRRVMNAVQDTAPQPPDLFEPVVFGVDWGKHEDFTVISVVNATTKTQVYQDRFKEIDYVVQAQRLKALYRRYKPAVIIPEANAMGEPIIEQLVRDGLPVQPFVTTNATKAIAVEALALAFEREEISILNDPVLINELQAFEMNRLPSGLIRYSAPQGLHDDTVMALALAWQGVSNYSARPDISSSQALTAGQAW